MASNGKESREQMRRMTLSVKQFEIRDDQFVFDGKPVQIISGAIHYFRVVPEYWEHRLRQLKACGLNTVETYVAWNVHEPKPGTFNFDGMYDLVRFLEVAHSLDLMTIVRPSPYICAEWDLGGMPPWLLAVPGITVRCYNPPYLEAVDRFYDQLITRLAPLQCTKGGPIIAVQIENEYGSYGNDSNYLAYQEESLRKRGIDVPLFTSDGPTDVMLQGGTLPHIHKTANFGSGPKGGFAKLREYQPNGPLMCAEFWNGWFDHWGEKHHTRDAADAAACLDEMLGMGASVNFYMFHGGTNFGFGSGANFDKAYQPTVTSYDYDSPVSESGDITAKYHAFRDVIGKYRSLPDGPLPQTPPRAAFGTVALTQQAILRDSLLEIAGHPIVTGEPKSMEQLGQNAGLTLYRTNITGPREAMTLHLDGVHDRVHVFVNGELKTVWYRNDAPDTMPKIAVPAEGITLELLVENMGHVNYGRKLSEQKGITEGIRHGYQFLFGWETFRLPLDDLTELKWQTIAPTVEPAFFRATVTIEKPADTFVKLAPEAGWNKGVCFVNGFNLGRYWSTQEPKQNLYLPGPLLRNGENEIIVLELDGQSSSMPTIELTDISGLER
jgi:beta-galactosidase